MLQGVNGSFRQCDARTTHFRRHVLHLWQPVPHSQHPFLIIDMDAGFERELWNHCRVHVGDSHAGMLGEDMSSTRLAPFTKAVRRFVVSADIVRTLGDAHGFGSPQRESVDGPRGPATTRLTMAVPHSG